MHPTPIDSSTLRPDGMDKKPSFPPLLAAERPSGVLPLLTRDRLRDGSALRELRASAPACLKVRSDAELEASLAETLKDHESTQDVWVFAYGSLMWNPAMQVAESRRADLRGWCRRFCIRLTMGRGTPEVPGLMLALDRGGVCRGLALRIAAADVQEELALLWRREMLAGSYEPRWVHPEIDGVRVKALTFVVNRHSDRYACGLSAVQAADVIATGKGVLGTCASYFHTTLATLHALGIRDAGMERVRRALAELPAAA